MTNDWDPTPIDPPSARDIAAHAYHSVHGEWPSETDIDEMMKPANPLTLSEIIGSSVSENDPGFYRVGLYSKFGEDSKFIEDIGNKMFSKFPSLGDVRSLRLQIAEGVRDKIHDEIVYYNKEGVTLEAVVERAVHNALGDLLLEIYKRISFDM